MSGNARFEFIDSVTSDLSFAARGDTLGDLFAASAEALLAATVEDWQAVRAEVPRSVELRDDQADLLLLRFLNELIYLRDVDRLLLRPQRVSVSADGEELVLEARLAGEPIDRACHELVGEPKAATAHALTLQSGPDGWTATVTVDV